MSANDTPAPDLAARILQLERRQRRQFGIIILLVLAGLLQVVEHVMPGPGVVFANRFVLRRSGQPPRGEFSIWQDGTPALRLNDDEGKARALWALQADGWLSLRMLDSNYTKRAEIAVEPDGSPHVVLSRDNGHPRVHLHVNGEKGALDYPAW
jgi:hypothetical protein